MEENGKSIILFGSLSEKNGMEWNTHSSLFSPNLKFSFPLKLGGIGKNMLPRYQPKRGGDLG